MDEKPFDIEDYRWPDEPSTTADRMEEKLISRATDRKAVTKEVVRFIGCPIDWFDRAVRLPIGKELAVVMLLFRERFLQGEGRGKARKPAATVKFTNAELYRLGIEAKTKKRVLAKMVDAGLIKVDQRGRCAPLVTFLD
jgi:hypothetical protein